jgi:hypothetical protein
MVGCDERVDELDETGLVGYGAVRDGREDVGKGAEERGKGFNDILLLCFGS